MTWYKIRKKAATRGIKDLESNIDNTGLIIIRTPTKPINIAIHIFGDTFSFKNIADRLSPLSEEERQKLRFNRKNANIL